MQSLFDKLADARDRLVAAGSKPDEAAIDVDAYARTILGWDKATLLANQRLASPPMLEPRFSEWIARRQQREPTAYILRSREFWGREFLVTPAVLIPRPETEFIVEASLAVANHASLSRIADIGTGSGVLAITLALELPDASVVATDLSGNALAVARENAERLGVSGRVRFVETSYLDGVAESFDLIVANPPYVKEGDRAGLSADVGHEPAVALFGGSDGLRDLGGVLDAAVVALRTGGWLVMEFGYGQEADVRRLVDVRPDLRVDRIRTDLQGIPRTAVIRRVSS